MEASKAVGQGCTAFKTLPNSIIFKTIKWLEGLVKVLKVSLFFFFFSFSNECEAQAGSKGKHNMPWRKQSK